MLTYIFGTNSVVVLSPDCTEFIQHLQIKNPIIQCNYHTFL